LPQGEPRLEYYVTQLEDFVVNHSSVSCGAQAQCSTTLHAHFTGDLKEVKALANLR
jgi:hypothetical protein